MNVTTKFLIVCGVAAMASPAFGDDAFNPLAKARCLRCEFGPGISTSWRSGTPKSTPVHFGKEGLLTFDAIDPAAGKARMIGGGVANVRVISTSAGITFVEQTETGSLVLTTVFAQLDASEPPRYIAVMSRHVGMPTGGPMLSQFHGTCAILE